MHRYENVSKPEILEKFKKIELDETSKDLRKRFEFVCRNKGLCPECGEMHTLKYEKLPKKETFIKQLITMNFELDSFVCRCLHCGYETKNLGGEYRNI